MSKEVEEFIELVTDLKTGLEQKLELVVTVEQIVPVAQSIYKYRHEQPRGFPAKGGKPFTAAKAETKKVTGTVAKVYEKDGRRSFSIDGQWYSTFDEEIAKGIEQGNSVEFTVEKNAKGFWNITAAEALPY